MYTPFKKRATEYLRDGETLLAIVTPDFFSTLLEQPIRDGSLFDRLVRVVGTPGSGKTTLAKLLQFENAAIVARRREEHREVFDFLESVGAVVRGQLIPSRLTTRLPMESEYREFWELSYEPASKNQLLLNFIQARTVLNWLQQLKTSEISLTSLEMVIRNEYLVSARASDSISAIELGRRAAETESAIYSVVGSLIPPKFEDLPDSATRIFDPFSVLQGVRTRNIDIALGLILDDFHLLHKEQRKFIYRALTRRELAIGRWLMMRYDALSVPRVLALRDQSKDDELPPDVDLGREVLDVLMQEPGSANKFNRAAPKMANQQLAQISLLQNNGITTLNQAIVTDPPQYSDRALKDLQDAVGLLKRKNGISAAREAAFREGLVPFVSDREADVREKALAILMERYVRRVPQVSLLEDLDPEPRRPVAPDAEVVDAARLQLMHENGRPYYFGPDILAAAASGNAEQYLRLCAPLIDALETQVIQRKGKRLAAATQHERLRRISKKYIDEWTFPENQAVRKLTDLIGKKARQRTLEPTAPVTPGVNAIGIRSDHTSSSFAANILALLTS